MDKMKFSEFKFPLSFIIEENGYNDTESGTCVCIFACFKQISFIFPNANDTITDEAHGY